jgi:hypothetical protein
VALRVLPGEVPSLASGLPGAAEVRVIVVSLLIFVFVGTALSILFCARRPQPRKPRLEVLSGGAGDAEFAAQQEEARRRA